MAMDTSTSETVWARNRERIDARRESRLAGQITSLAYANDSAIRHDTEERVELDSIYQSIDSGSGI